MNNFNIYNNPSFSKNIGQTILYLIFGIVLFQLHIIVGVLTLFITFITLITTISTSINTTIYQDRLVIKFLYGSSTILFSSIHQVKNETRYVRLVPKNFLVVKYTESSGFGNEITYFYEESMYQDLKKRYTEYKSV